MTEPLSPPAAAPPNIPEDEWLALATATETLRPDEWPYIMQVVLSRARTRAKSVYEVVREPRQFSAFNATRNLPLAAELPVFETTLRQLGEGGEALVSRARRVALAMMQLTEECNLLLPGTEMYWSPRSMTPAGSLPNWNWGLLHCYTVPSIAAERFVFAQLRPFKSPGTGNQAAFGKEEEA